MQIAPAIAGGHMRQARGGARDNEEYSLGVRGEFQGDQWEIEADREVEEELDSCGVAETSAGQPWAWEVAQKNGWDRQ